MGNDLRVLVNGILFPKPVIDSNHGRKGRPWAIKKLIQGGVHAKHGKVLLSSKRCGSFAGLILPKFDWSFSA